MPVINNPTFSQKNVAFQVVKKLPEDFMGQISRNKAIMKGIIKTTSDFIL